MNKKNIITLLAGFVIFCCMSYTGCSHSAYTVSLEKGKSVTKKINGQAVTLTVTDIADNRCPPHVNCIRAGEAVVKLLISGKTVDGENLSLCIGADCRQPAFALATINAQKFKLNLNTVTPMPGTEADGKSKKAAITISAVQ